MLLQMCSLHSHFYAMLIYLYSKKIKTVSETPPPYFNHYEQLNPPILATETTSHLAHMDDQIHG